MDTTRIAEMLCPYVEEAEPSPALLAQLQRYLDLLLRWNARVNLTAVRNPEEIVTRHFGESLFAARVLLGEQHNATASRTLSDVGSGAGFPGIPMKLFAPEVALTLIESHNKKATFLREVVRTLGLEGVDVFCGRAEQWGKTADFVTVRALEHFQRTLPVAAALVAAGGKLCLLIGTGQIPTAQEILGAGWRWEEPELVPRSSRRVVLVANAASRAADAAEADSKARINRSLAWVRLYSSNSGRTSDLGWFEFQAGDPIPAKRRSAQLATKSHSDTRPPARDCDPRAVLPSTQSSVPQLRRQPLRHRERPGPGRLNLAHGKVGVHHLRDGRMASPHLALSRA